jgi:stage II sporulation protein D
MIRSGLQSVPDRLSLLPRRNGKSDLVATMDVEEYLKGVLPMEMPVAWPIEALKAQAIAARTFTLNRIAERDRVGGSYHVEANVMDQVFKFDTGLSSAEKFKIETAVSETRGMVLKDKKDRAIAAYFHADCGGQTEDARSVWGSGPSMGLAVDASCPVHSVWQARLSRKSIAKHLSQNDPTMGSKKLASLVTLSKTGTGRVDAMKAVWSDGSESSMSGHAFRMAMGHELIKSTKFEFRSDAASGEIVFNGSGHGHGVGLCQWGARQMASQGKKFEQILAHYYPNATLTGLRSP